MSTDEPASEQRVAIRRSPRLSAFVLVFGAIGFLGTLIVTGLYEADPSLGFGTVFAYFSLYGITGSVAVGIVVWLLLDLRSKRRATETTMAREDHSDD
jgi:hypothetical protein